MFKAFCKGCQHLDLSGRWLSATYVEVDNLHQKGADDKDEKYPKEPRLVFRLAANPGNDGGTEALRANDTEAADPAADGNVDEHVLVTPSRPYIKRSDDGANNNDTGIREEAGRNDKVLHLLGICDG